MQDFVNKTEELTTNITLSSHLHTGNSNSLKASPNKRKQAAKESKGGIERRSATEHYKASQYDDQEDNLVSIDVASGLKADRQPGSATGAGSRKNR